MERSFSLYKLTKTYKSFSGFHKISHFKFFLTSFGQIKVVLCSVMLQTNIISMKYVFTCLMGQDFFKNKCFFPEDKIY